MFPLQSTVSLLTVGEAKISLTGVQYAGTVGSLPSDNPFGSKVSITAIDEATPSITTDGGIWSGTDGTGDQGDGRYEPDQEWSNYVSSPSGIKSSRPATAAFDGLTTTWCACEDLGTVLAITFPGPIPFTSSVEMYSDNTWAVSVDGGSDLTITSSAWTTLVTGSGTFTTIYIKQGTTGSNPSLNALRVDGKILINSSVPGGGGETQVTGPTFTATGTVTSVDTAANTMTFSETTGRWLETQAGYQADLKLNCKVASDDQVLADATLYTLIDAEGNVSDISATDPGYKAMVTNATINADFNIKFPNVLGNGETPDQALPEGAQISVDILAANIAGTDEALHGTTGASVTPVDTGAPEGQMRPVIYTGNGTSKTITCGFAPDMVWTKQRSGTRDHVIVDTVRGADSIIYPSEDYAEAATGAGCAFNPDGITFGADLHQNQNGADYVAWCFDAGDTTTANYDGSIASQVRSNGYFSVVSYIGNTTAGASFGHGLNSQPQMVILKRYNTDGSWITQHVGIGLGSGRLILNEPTAAASSASTVYWNDTAPDASVVTLGTNPEVNSGNVIAYCWAETPTQSFGSYTGGGTPEIECGFEPAFVMIKCTSDAANWLIIDNARDPANPASHRLFPNLNAAEENPTSDTLNFTSTGFQVIRTQGNALTENSAGQTYIYAAFAGTTTRFDSNDANDVAAFNTVKAKLDAYPADRRAYRGALLASIVTSGLTADQKTYLLRQGSDGNALESGPFNLNGYYPLYDTEEVANDVSDNNDSHSHTFGGVEYFMPDTGVTIYHGTYDDRDTGTED